MITQYDASGNRLQFEFGFVRMFTNPTNNKITLREMFAKSLGMPVLGQDEYNEMIQNPAVVPEYWQKAGLRFGLRVHFLGTIGMLEGDAFVTTLFWNGQRWTEDRIYLWDNDLDGKNIGWNDVVAVWKRVEY